MFSPWDVTAIRPRTDALADYNTSEGPISFSYYLDEIFGVDVLSSQDYMHRYRHQGDPSAYQENVQPSLYSVAVNAWGYTRDFKFPTKEAAEQVAALLRESVKQ